MIIQIPLLALETSRQVLIDWPSETLGRLRIPHISYEKKLCPFQTPESKRIGLQINLTAGARVNDGKIIAGDDLFSVACGLIPYPHHTDGSRLMMGGKNMKQADTGIAGAEAPIVPGYYEGDYSADIEILRTHMKDKRFFPYLGLNALTERGRKAPEFIHGDIRLYDIIKNTVVASTIGGELIRRSS